MLDIRLREKLHLRQYGPVVDFIKRVYHAVLRFKAVQRVGSLKLHSVFLQALQRNDCGCINVPGFFLGRVPRYRGQAQQAAAHAGPETAKTKVNAAREGLFLIALHSSL